MNNLTTPPAGILADEDAAWMRRNLATVPPEKSESVRAKLNEYEVFRAQHPKPLTPDEFRRRRDEEDKIFGLYEAPDKADFGPMVGMLPLDKQSKVKARVANEYFLGHVTGRGRGVYADSMQYAAERGRVAARLFEGRGADSDEGFAKEAGQYFTKRRDRRYLIEGKEGSDEASKAINERSLARWATRAALAGEDPVASFKLWMDNAKPADKEDFYSVWNDQYSGVAATVEKHRPMLKEAFDILRKGMGVEEGGASIFGAVTDAASPLAGMSEEDFRTVGVPALRAMAELAAGGDKGRLQQAMEAFRRPVDNAAGSAFDVLDWFGQSLSAAGAGTESMEQGDKQRTIKTLLRAVADDAIDPIKVLATSRAGRVAEQMLYDTSGSLGYMATAAIPGAGIGISLAGYQDSNKAQLLMRNPTMSAADAGAIGAAAAPIQTALDRLSLKMISGQMPVLSGLISRAAAPGGNAAMRFALYGAGAVGTEYTAEILQDAAPLAMQDVLSALKADVPEANWDDLKVLDARTFFAVLPLSLIGAGVNVVRDQGTARALLNDTVALKSFGLSDTQLETIQASPDPMGTLQAEWGKRTPPPDAPAQWQDYSANLEQETTALAETLDVSGVTMERTTRDGEAVYQVTRGDVMTEHPTAGSALAAVQNHLKQTDQEANGPMLEMLAELDANPLSPVREGKLILAEGETVAQFQAKRAAIMQDDTAAPDVRARAERESAAMTRRQQVFEQQFPDAPVDWRAVSVGGQSELEVKDGVARAVIRVANGESAYTPLEEKTEAEAEAWVRSGATSWDSLRGMIEQVEKATGDTYLNGFTDGADTAQDQLAVKEAYSELSQVHVTGKGRAGKAAASGIAEVARMDRKGARLNLRQAMAQGKVAAELVARLKAQAEWLRAVVTKAIRLNRARREAGGAFAIDEFLNKSVGIEVEMQHAAGVTAEAARIFPTESNQTGSSSVVDAQPMSSDSELTSSDPGFRLTPIATLDALAAQMAKRTRDPDARRKVYEQMMAALTTMRTRWTETRAVWNGQTRPIVEKRTKAELDKEQAMHEALEYDRLTVQGIEEKQARNTAREAAADWRREQDEMQAKDWDGRAVMLRHLRTLDAILSALPPDVRAKVGGWTAVASLKTQAAMQKELEHRLEMADKYLETYLKKDALEAIGKVMEKSRPDAKPGEKSKGKLGAETHAWLDGVAVAMAMTQSQATVRMDEIEGRMLNPDLTSDEQVALATEYAQLMTFAGLELRGAGELTDILDQIETAYVKGREGWGAVVAARREAWAEERALATKETGMTNSISDQLKGGAKRATEWLSSGLSNLIPGTYEISLQRVFGKKSKTAARLAQRAREATRMERDAVLAKESAFDAALERILPFKNKPRYQRKVARNKWLDAFLEPQEGKVTLREGAKSATIKVPIETFGKILAGEVDAKTFDLTSEEVARLTLTFEALPADSRVESLEMERFTGGVDKPAAFSEAEAARLLAMWGQEAYRDGMRLAGIDEQAIAEMEAMITPEGTALMNYILKDLADGWAPTNAVFQRMEGVRLPRIQNYFPGLFETNGDTRAMELEGSGVQNGNLTSGHLRGRKAHKAAPKIDGEHHSINLLSVYWNHIAQNEHWKAWAEVVRDTKQVLANKEVAGAVEAAHGVSARKDLMAWLNNHENGGLVSGYENMQMGRLMRRWMRARAQVKLAAKIPVLAIQATGSIASLLDLPFRQGMRSMGRVLTGRAESGVKAAFAHPVIQRRVKSGSTPALRIAKAGRAGQRGGYISYGLELALNPVGVTDGIFSSIAAAAAYDAHYNIALRAGATPADAAETANERMQATIERTAQPAEAMEKSLMENSSNLWFRSLTMFSSDPRQKVALELAALRHAIRGDGSWKDFGRMFLYTHIVLGSMNFVIRGILNDAMKDNDDEDEDGGDAAWEAENWLLAMVLGPFSGLPILGDAIGYAANELAGLRNFGDDTVIVEALGDAATIKQLANDPPVGEEAEAYWRIASRTLKGVGQAIGGDAAIIGVAASIGDQISGMWDNANTTELEAGKNQLEKEAREDRAKKPEPTDADKKEKSDKKLAKIKDAAKREEK